MESILIRALEMFDLLTCDFRGGDYADSCARVLMECRSSLLQCAYVSFPMFLDPYGLTPSLLLFGPVSDL
jgi:hypothetical protein